MIKGVPVAGIHPPPCPLPGLWERELASCFVKSIIEYELPNELAASASLVSIEPLVSFSSLAKDHLLSLYGSSKPGVICSQLTYPALQSIISHSWDTATVWIMEYMHLDRVCSCALKKGRIRGLLWVITKSLVFGWSWEENKLFELALAFVDEWDSCRWDAVTAFVRG